ncbi:MAG: DUF362 domain-containing protein [Candidatus Brocadiales bacterium]
MARKISRRQFVKGAVATGASLLVAPAVLMPSPEALGRETKPSDISGVTKSRVAVVTDQGSVDNDTWEIRGERANAMVERMLLSLTGSASIEESWNSIIPTLKPMSRVSIKVNCINPRLPSHPEVALAIAESLIRAGVRDNNIIIWDRSEGNIIEGLVRCGYKINTSGSGLRCLAVTSRGVGYDEHNRLRVPSIGRDFPVTRIVSQMCDHIINLSVLKDHGISGFTGGLKNFYGAIPLWDKFAVLDVRRMHRNRANPQIAELYNNSLIRDKVRLSVCDALIGCYEGGPSGRPQWVNYQLLGSLDPVALDSYGLGIIDTKRREVGKPPVRQRAGYIRSAAKLGLGTDNMDEIEVVNSVLG